MMETEKRSYDITAQSSVLNRLEKFFLFLQENHGSSRIYGLWFDGDGADRPFRVEKVIGEPGNALYNEPLPDVENGEEGRAYAEDSNHPFVRGDGRYSRIKLVEEFPRVLQMIEYRASNKGVDPARIHEVCKFIRELFPEMLRCDPVDEGGVNLERTEYDPLPSLPANQPPIVGWREEDTTRIKEEYLGNGMLRVSTAMDYITSLKEEYQRRGVYRYLGEWLVEFGIITQENLEEALRRQRTTMANRKLGEILVRLGYTTQTEIIRVLSLQLNLPIIPLSDIEISRKVISQVDDAIATLYRAIPVGENNGVLVVATADPTNIHVLDNMARLLDRPIEPAIAMPLEIEKALFKYYGHKESKEPELLISAPRKESFAEWVRRQARGIAERADAQLTKELSVIISSAKEFEERFGPPVKVDPPVSPETMEKFLRGGGKFDVVRLPVEEATFGEECLVQLSCEQRGEWGPMKIERCPEEEGVKDPDGSKQEESE